MRLRRRVIGQPLPALIAALVLALAPVHVILSRQALDYILPVPFVLGWLWCLDASLRAREGSTSRWRASSSASAVTATSRRGR
jgi:4-amino-4-deoxy-L-arabinose transferase-like glycosyltransferase